MEIRRVYGFWCGGGYGGGRSSGHAGLLKYYKKIPIAVNSSFTVDKVVKTHIE
jgi:hypothetical protein